ncbi:guanine nucleotide-binding protein subunit gamma-e-like [Ptychodera flava]|uniref:guanine nucleotide-binding protein subunit gamma-e-like n=1 Tax=Ptychodera flava TaxID=63121 RepID=UPI00396A7411
MSQSDTKAALQKKVHALKYQLDVERLPASQTIPELVDFVKQNEGTDPFLHPLDKKENPWADRSKCTIL